MGANNLNDGGNIINGLINHDMDLIRQDILHRNNTRNKGNFRLPRVKRNWGSKEHNIMPFPILTPSHDQRLKECK